MLNMETLILHRDFYVITHKDSYHYGMMESFWSSKSFYWKW